MVQTLDEQISSQQPNRKQHMYPINFNDTFPINRACLLRQPSRGLNEPALQEAGE